MANEKTLSDLEIVAKLRAEKPFSVRGEKERKRVLIAARFVDLSSTVTTRGNARGLFTVFFVPNGGSK